MGDKEADRFFMGLLTQPMANLTKLLEIAYLIEKIKFKLLFHRPLAE